MDNKERRVRLEECALKLAKLLDEYEMEIIVEEAGTYDRFISGIVLSDDWGVEVKISGGDTVDGSKIKSHIGF